MLLSYSFHTAKDTTAQLELNGWKTQERTCVPAWSETERRHWPDSTLHRHTLPSSPQDSRRSLVADQSNPAMHKSLSIHSSYYKYKHKVT